MLARFFAIPLFVLTFTSCDKAKNLVGKASSAVKDQIAAKTGDKGTAEVDAPLQQLVDQTAEGAIFRKDLAFPQRLEVRTTCRREMSGRFFHVSAIEKRSEVINGTRIHISKLERAGDQIRYTLEQSSFSMPVPEGTDGEAKVSSDPLEQLAPSTRPVTFRKSGKSWKADERDGFRAAVLSRELTPVFDELLIENALAPRPLWFAKRRIKVGDQLVVTGDSLPMLLAGDAKGSFDLKLESFEPVEGHPCGVFSVTGDFSRKQMPDFEGGLTDEDVTIQAGKIWLSLLYPVILREELDTIQTFKSGGRGGLEGRGQGSIKLSVKRDWKILPAAVDAPAPIAPSPKK